jgi:hypothetical protein
MHHFAIGVAAVSAGLYAALHSLLATEMEADTLFVVCSARRWRSGAAFAVASAAPFSADQPPPEADPAQVRGEQALIDMCLEAMAALARAEQLADLQTRHETLD